MTRLILGFTGEMASGKGTCAAYLKERYHAETFRFSSALFDVAHRMHLKDDRDTLQKISTWFRKEFGEDTLAKVMFEDAKSASADLVVIDGVRRLEDVKYLRALPEFVLVYLDAPMRVRYERMVLRGEKADDTTKTFEEFEKDHQRESELEIPKLREFSREILDNGGTKDELFARLDEIVKRHGA
jgi:dephospho-CoA kinase